MAAEAAGNTGEKDAPGFAEKLGLPSPAGRWRVVGAVVTDTFGTGLIFPISLLYFTLVTHYSVVLIGSLLTIATFASLPFGLVGGQLADRFGPGKVLVANNLCSAIGYIGYYLADRTYVIFVGMFLVAVADRMFWSSWPPYLRLVAAGDRYDTWFAFIEALKMGCLGLGAGLAGLLLGVGGHTAVRALVLINIATCLVSAVLVSLQRLPARRAASAEQRQPRSSWRPVLTDVRIVAMAAGQLLGTPVSLLGAIALPVFYVRAWHLGAWVGPTLFLIASVVFFLSQSITIKVVRNVKPIAVLTLSCGFFCAAMAILVVFSSYYHPARGLAFLLALVVTIIIAFGIMLNFPTSNSVLMSMVSDQTTGRATGLFHTGTAVAMAISPFLMSRLLGTPSELWIVMAAGTVASTACFALAIIRSARMAAIQPPDAASLTVVGEQL
jgi:MFS family permease